MAQHLALVTTQTRSRQSARGWRACCAPCPTSCLPWHRSAALSALRGLHLGNCAGVSASITSVSHDYCSPPTPHGMHGKARRSGPMQKAMPPYLFPA